MSSPKSVKELEQKVNPNTFLIKRAHIVRRVQKTHSWGGYNSYVWTKDKKLYQREGKICFQSSARSNREDASLSEGLKRTGESVGRRKSIFNYSALKQLKQGKHGRRGEKGKELFLKFVKNNGKEREVSLKTQHLWEDETKEKKTILGRRSHTYSMSRRNLFTTLSWEEEKVVEKNWERIRQGVGYSRACRASACGVEEKKGEEACKGGEIIAGTVYAERSDREEIKKKLRSISRARDSKKTEGRRVTRRKATRP